MTRLEWIARPAVSSAYAASVQNGSFGQVATALEEGEPDAGDDDLAYRIRPIREQWEARGPGLLRALEQWTEPLAIEDAAVALVAPVVGGHGVPLLEQKTVLFEAVLANPHPQLPEVVRLAWLLAQLSGEAERVALAPAVLAAAEEVELVAADEPTLAYALLAWRVTPDEAEAAKLAGPLWRWWEAYRESADPWPAALTSAPVCS